MRVARQEQGLALGAVVILMVIAAVLVVGISVVAMSALNRSSDARDKVLADGPAGDGVSAYRKLLSSAIVGEHTGFVMDYSAMRRIARETNPAAGICTGSADPMCLLPNSSPKVAFPTIDARNIPANARYTMRRRVSNGQYRFWQVLALSPPRYGFRELAAAPGVFNAAGSPVSPGGAVVVYIRGWTGSEDVTGRAVKPSIIRAELRPPRFSDYQILADGKIRMGSGATINGKIHSNGFDQSFLDQYKTIGAAITVTNTPPAPTCTAGARLSTKSGDIDTAGVPSCASAEYKDIGEQVNLQRVSDGIAMIRPSQCGAMAPVRVVCVSGGASPYNVTLSGTTITGDAGTIDARNTTLGAWPVGSVGKYGAIIVFDHSVDVRGTLSPDARVTIIASRQGLPGGSLTETPAIRFTSTGTVGSAGDPRTTVGLVADGDVVAIESAACPLNVRAALIAQGGMLSYDPLFRGGVPGDVDCGGTFGLRGSIAGHLPPYMTGTGVGYAQRAYSYDSYLFDNPPPLFPVTGPWEVLSTKAADLDCFDNSSNLQDVKPCR